MDRLLCLISCLGISSAGGSVLVLNTGLAGVSGALTGSFRVKILIEILDSAVEITALAIFVLDAALNPLAVGVLILIRDAVVDVPQSVHFSL